MKKNIIVIFLISISLLSCSSAWSKGQVTTTTQVMRSLTLPLYSLQQHLPIKQSYLPAHSVYRTSNYLMYAMNKRLKKLSHQLHYLSMKIKQQFLLDDEPQPSSLSKVTSHHRPFDNNDTDESTD